mmetsp:Transcript_11007/g.30896  ORF Transcript_11007/g.30896 Transcript_11007/m.30896 type:complete len:276 (-) Transcript_11007:2949-3776(-)
MIHLDIIDVGHFLTIRSDTEHLVLHQGSVRGDEEEHLGDLDIAVSASARIGSPALIDVETCFHSVLFLVTGYPHNSVPCVDVIVSVVLVRSSSPTFSLTSYGFVVKTLGGVNVDARVTLHRVHIKTLGHCIFTTKVEDSRLRRELDDAPGQSLDADVVLAILLGSFDDCLESGVEVSRHIALLGESHTKAPIKESRNTVALSFGHHLRVETTVQQPEIRNGLEREALLFAGLYIITYSLLKLVVVDITLFELGESISKARATIDRLFPVICERTH